MPNYSSNNNVFYNAASNLNTNFRNASVVSKYEVIQMPLPQTAHQLLRRTVSVFFERASEKIGRALVNLGKVFKNPALTPTEKDRLSKYMRRHTQLQRAIQKQWNEWNTKLSRTYTRPTYLKLSNFPFAPLTHNIQPHKHTKLRYTANRNYLNRLTPKLQLEMNVMGHEFAKIIRAVKNRKTVPFIPQRNNRLILAKKNNVMKASSMVNAKPKRRLINRVSSFGKRFQRLSPSFLSKFVQ